jgi:parvulin-like peptidyl-prolyl isomerase
MNLPILSLFPLLLGFLGSNAGAELVDRVEAVVNKRAVFYSDLGRFRNLTPLRAKIDPLFMSEPLAKKAKPADPEILEFLIDEMVIADRFPVTDSEVEQEINAIQTNLKIDRDTLKTAIGREGFKFDDYFKLMRVSLSKKQLIDREIRNKAAVSEDEVRSEYNRQFASSKKFRGSFRLFLIRVSKANFKSPAAAKEEAERALDAIKKGEAFESVAKRVSDDASQDSGGDLGFLSYSEMSSGIQKEVQTLGPGKTSSLIDEKGAYLIVRIGDVKSDNDSAFDKEKDQIRARLMEGEFQHQIRLWLDRERANNYVKISQKTP